MRGKCGAAAAVRQEVQTRDAEIETYRNRVAKLTAENKDLRRRVETERQEAAKRERVLLGRLTLAAAPKVEALEKQVAALTEKSRQANVLAQKRLDERLKVVTAYGRFLVNSAGLTYEDALREIASVMGVDYSVPGSVELKAIRSGQGSRDTARQIDAVVERKRDLTHRRHASGLA